MLCHYSNTDKCVRVEAADNFEEKISIFREGLKCWGIVLALGWRKFMRPHLFWQSHEQKHVIIEVESCPVLLKFLEIHPSHILSSLAGHPAWGSDEKVHLSHMHATPFVNFKWLQAKCLLGKWYNAITVSYLYSPTEPESAQLIVAYEKQIGSHR